MRYDPERHHRRSIRLKDYDYTRMGAYFVTLCTRNRTCLFGEIVAGEMRLNEYGEIVQEEWFRSAEIRREIVLFSDEFVVMPNHIHGIVRIVESPNAHVGATGPTAGATDATVGATDATAGATDATAGATDATAGATDATAGATDATAGATDATVGATDATAGATDAMVGATDATVGATGRSPLQGPAKRSLASFVAGFKSAVTKRINDRRGTPGATVWQRNYYEHIIRHEESLNRIRAYILNNPLQWHLDHEHAPATDAPPWADER
ncbi:transposase [Chloracidobacterium sp. MS 40/45]|uniref:transposase n=1 Tax=Chloracidobacterium aggregatum TaxID=2851959 RepID=UPI001B8CC420|nr:transposase [Chloracidobacterium aggregatum]QUW01469.1 transposase [Chloracidobacterium sp. MS 40/45]